MTITSEGDVGDICYVLAVINAIPNGPHSLLIERNSAATKQKNIEIATALLNFCGPLVSSQEYIQQCRMMEEGERPDWRSGGFRDERMHSRTNTLLSAHLTHFNFITKMGLVVDVNKPWLKVDPSKESFDKVVVNRTERYKNHMFPWKRIVEHYGERIIFVGHQHEHGLFCSKFGNVAHRKTTDLLEVARLIAGSSLFIGNQSCAFAVAEGLKHPSIQETDTSLPDCIFIRDNVQHVHDGTCTLPDVDGSGGLALTQGPADPMEMDRGHSPPGGWKYNDKVMGNGFNGAMIRMMRLREFNNSKRELVEKILLEHNAAKVPEFFSKHRPDLSGTVRTAIRNAEITSQQKTS